MSHLLTRTVAHNMLCSLDFTIDPDDYFKCRREAIDSHLVVYDSYSVAVDEPFADHGDCWKGKRGFCK